MLVEIVSFLVEKTAQIQMKLVLVLLMTLSLVRLSFELTARSLDFADDVLDPEATGDDLSELEMVIAHAGIIRAVVAILFR